MSFHVNFINAYNEDLELRTEESEKITDYMKRLFSNYILIFFTDKLSKIKSKINLLHYTSKLFYTSEFLIMA